LLFPQISTLKESLVTKEELYQQELDDVRTQADRDVWELRRKLQRLDESSYDRRQQLEDKHREELGQYLLFSIYIKDIDF
jgi:hypothetical protein